MESASFTFSPFPRLPVELRLKIWRQAIAPRLVHIEWSRRHRQCVSGDIPAILQVSREARIEGLKTYRPCFNTSKSATPVYFDFELDTACFVWKTFGRRPAKHGVSLRDDCRRIRFMAIDSCVRLDNGMELINFESLKELQIIGCTEQMPDTIADPALFACTFKPWVKSVLPGRKVYSVPNLTCLDQGTSCRDHWWFEGWNERCTGTQARDGVELNCWQLMFTVINDLARGCLHDRETYYQPIEPHASI